MIEFYKMSGSGNDFIIIDNRDLSLDIGDLSAFARKVCKRKFSVGADGLVVIEPSDNADFKWRFFNSDGSLAEMCGNAARCTARFAYMKGIAGQKLSWETIAGIISAEVKEDIVKVKLTDPSPVKAKIQIEVDGQKFILDSIDTGVPHAVVFSDDLDNYDVNNHGRQIRYHEYFSPRGTNADFATIINRHKISLRTYERGVENETLACGTGMVAAALAAAQRGLVESPVEVLVMSGETLLVYFENQKGFWREIYLEGKVKMVYHGFLFEEAYKS
ncbi:MAG: diaminopimelate epimerase [Deltaproteobacteria bacterium]|nr:diaminopimelate epimerase [Deltaproteobacteria bacterium]